MNTELVLAGFSIFMNGVMGFLMFLLKDKMQDLKEADKENRDAIEKVRAASFLKEDFKDFKEELWRRLDEVKHDFNQKLQEQKHV